MHGSAELQECTCRALLRQYEQRPPPLAPLAASLRTLSTLCDDLEAPGSTSRCADHAVHPHPAGQYICSQDALSTPCVEHVFHGPKLLHSRGWRFNLHVLLCLKQ